MIYINPGVCALGQPLRKRSPTLDRAYPKIPRRRMGKRHHNGGDVCGLVVLRVDRTFRTIPIVGILRGGSFSFPPEPLFVKLLIWVNQNTKRNANNGHVGMKHTNRTRVCKKIHLLRVGWRNLVRVSLIFGIIVSFVLFTVFPLVYVLYFEVFLIHDSRGFMILKKI